MKVLVSFVVCVVALTSVGVAQSDIKLKIGAKLPRQYVLEFAGQIATHPSQFRPFIKETIAHVKYTIAFDEENRKIRYIHTVDRAFRTANGLHVGSEIKVTRKQLHSFGDWYTFAGTTPDGWQIISAETEASLGEWKESERKTVTIGGFSKGGN
jgi:hypothetical protein